MTGAYQTWQHGPAGWLVDLNDCIKSAKTSPNYNWNDIVPNLRASDSSSGKTGDPLGEPGAHQWALLWSYEMSIISYNKGACSTGSNCSRPRTCRS